MLSSLCFPSGIKLSCISDADSPKAISVTLTKRHMPPLLPWSLEPGGQWTTGKEARQTDKQTNQPCLSPPSKHLNFLRSQHVLSILAFIFWSSGKHYGAKEGQSAVPMGRSAPHSLKGECRSAQFFAVISTSPVLLLSFTSEGVPGNHFLEGFNPWMPLLSHPYRHPRSQVIKGASFL